MITEQYNSNRKSFIDLCKNVFDFDDESIKYVENRLSDEWKPAEEIQKLIESTNSEVVDQRFSFDIDLSNEKVQDIFIQTDNAYEMFRSIFREEIKYLAANYSCTIGYNEFITNKVVFKKNVTKLKKVFEKIYEEEPSLFERHDGDDYTAKKAASFIVRAFEKIGASKKSARKLKLVVSYNPMDWLLSSTAEKSWSSCFNIDNPSGGYQYCLGLPFLCGDNNRVLLYITDGTTKSCMGVTTEHYMTRTWALINSTGNFGVIKWYPNDTIGVEPINAIIGTNVFSDRETFSHSKYPVDVLSTQKGEFIGVYSDMGLLKEENGQLWIVGNRKTGQQTFTKNLVETTSKISLSTDRRICNISWPRYVLPKWKEKGFHLDLMFNTLRCKCGSTKIGFSLGDDEQIYYCQDCYKKNVYVCGNCGKEEISTNGTKHTVITEDNREIVLCENCWYE